MTTGVLVEYTEEEKDKLLKLRESVSNILITDEEQDDSHLIRWLRARNLDLKKAEEMLRKNVEWRTVNEVVGIVEREQVPDDVMKESPVAWIGTNFEGFPVLLCPMGRHDTRKTLEKYGKEACKRFNIIFMERNLKMLSVESEKQGRKVTQIIQLIDLEGYSYRQISSKICREFLIEMQKTFDAHYPEFLKAAIIINAPKIFSILFHVLKPFISKNTLDKLSIYGPDKVKWKKVLSETLPMDKLPPYWGGTLEGKDEYCSGSEIWIQGPVDLYSFMNGIDTSDAEYTIAIVNARDKIIKEIDISEKGTVIEWKFKTENYDIGFQLHFCGTDNTESDEDGANSKDILPYTRVEAHNSVQQGSHICDTPGKYIFTFDNCYSLAKSKTLLYKISVIHPEPEFQECPEF